jgi:hypothetical protein
MRMHRRSPRAAIALVIVCDLLVSPIPVRVNAQTAPAPAKPTQAPPRPTSSPVTPPAATAAATAETVDGGWPRDFVTPAGHTLRMYQPQVASWDGQKKMVLYAAVGRGTSATAKPEMGTVKIEADTSVAVGERLVNFTDLKMTESNFPGLSNEQHREVVEQITSRILKVAPDGSMVMGLDRVLARLDKSQLIPKNVEGVKADPPAIFYSTTPAMLVNLDGDPIWSPIKQNDLTYAVNTNWDLFQDTPSKSYYLRNNDSWLVASDLKGPWKPAGTLPAAFKNLPPDDNWKEVKAALPGRSVKPANVPKVFVSTTPAELILVTGPPSYAMVSGTKLMWVSNTESDVFRMGTSGQVYFLVSGRWFSAPDFNGPWTFATLSLPDDFKNIPLSHPRSRVLASVPGTDQAAEAVLLAQVPQTARVSKKEVKAPDVDYDGEPKFEPIEKTTVSRAVNTDKDIIKVGDLYYMCFQGVWFMGRSPNGPWEVTGSVPGQIYEIPISSPAHSVTYVTVEDDDDDWVVFATAAAYTGMMVAWGCAVWGSGWYYPPYAYYGGFYPVYRGYYPTYGYHASYNPWTGAYSRGVSAYGPYGGAGVGARYNPRTGTYSRGAAAYGPYGGRGVAEAYNPRTGTYGATRQGSGVYGSWGQTGVQRGDQWATTSRVTNRATGTTTRRTDTSGGGTAITRSGAGGTSGIARTGSGDIYAGRDGNVYKRQDGGGWQQYNNGSGSWNSVQPRSGNVQGLGGDTRSFDSSTAGQLNRDSAARAEGAQRTRDYSSSSRSRTGSGSYRPSGGGARAPRGGGRRR